MGWVSWQCMCEGFPKWSLQKDQCPKCGRFRNKIVDVDYWIGYRLPNGKKRLEKGGHSVKQAEKILRDREHGLDTGTYVDVKAAGHKTLQDLIDKYTEKIRVDKPGYFKLTQMFKSRMLDFFGNVKFMALTANRIEEWKLSLRSQGMAESTVDNHLAWGKAMWNYCLPSLPNPWKKVKLYHPKNQLVRYLTDEQEEKVLAYAHEH